MADISSGVKTFPVNSRHAPNVNVLRGIQNHPAPHVETAPKSQPTAPRAPEQPHAGLKADSE